MSPRQRGTAPRRSPARSADLVVLRLLAALVFVPMALWWARTTVVAVVGGHEPVFGFEVAGGPGTAVLWLLVWTPLLVTASCGVILGVGALVRRAQPERGAPAPPHRPPSERFAAQGA